MTNRSVLVVTKSNPETLFYVQCSLLFFPHVLTALHTVRFSSLADFHMGTGIKKRNIRVFSCPKRAHGYKTSIQILLLKKNLDFMSLSTLLNYLYRGQLCVSSIPIFILQHT